MHMKYIIIALVGALIVIQFFRIDTTVPEYIEGEDLISVENPPKEVSNILVSACYDCHSYKTVYPWYSHVAPTSWWLADHIQEGREHLNFSIWGKYSAKRKKHKIKEMIEEIEEGEMPLKSYTLVHWNASLSDDQKKVLLEWLKTIK